LRLQSKKLTKRIVNINRIGQLRVFMPKNNLDFIEIGTADFDTLIQDCSDLAQGISIEPLSFYLDALPSKPHVIKLQKAVSNVVGLTEIYYLDPKVFLGDKVPSTGWWIRVLHGEYL